MTLRSVEGALRLAEDGSGVVQRPYPRSMCAGTGCGCPLNAAHAVYLFTDAPEGAIGPNDHTALLCDDCALDLQFAHDALGEYVPWRKVLTL